MTEERESDRWVVEVSRERDDPFHVEPDCGDFDAIEVSNRPGEVQRVRLVDYAQMRVMRLKNAWHEYVYDEETDAMVRKEGEADEGSGDEVGTQGAEGPAGQEKS